MGKGVVSGTNTNISRSQQHSKSVFINGRALVRTGDMVHMNRSGPGGGGSSAAASGKKARWDCRKGQIAAAKEQLQDMPEGAEKDRLQQATERFERNNVAVEHARLADATYGIDNKNPDAPIPAPEGWIPVDPKDPAILSQYGLESADLYDPESNFRAQIYEPDPAVFGNDLKPVVAFKGTQKWEDWKNNAQQAFNFPSSYYKKAVNIGTKLERSGALVHTTGHSLGGGLASAASRASGMPGTTFNSAGLNSKTVARYGGSVHQTDIQAYRTTGDPVTGVQELGVYTALAAGVGGLVGGTDGAVIGAWAHTGLTRLLPDAVGTPRMLEGKGLNPLDRHSMKQVIESLEEQKSEDQQIIASATGKNCDSDTKKHEPENFISEHAYKKHAYDPKATPSKKHTRYAENVDPAAIRKETLLSPDKVEKLLDKRTGEHYATRYTKDMKYNISQPPIESTISKVFINVKDKFRSTQFPFAS